MKMIVGLGNPGDKYLLTPHNIGWMVIDSFAHEHDIYLRKENEYFFQMSSINDEKILLIKPLTYMNLSGKAVRKAVSSYKISLDNLLIIHDDIDLPFLSLRFHKNRGSGGHNGIKNIHAELGSQDYARLKIGMKALSQTQKDFTGHSKKDTKRGTIDTPYNVGPFSGAWEWTEKAPFGHTTHGLIPTFQHSVTDVLKTFSEVEQKQLPNFLKLAKEAIIFFIQEGLEKAANRYNTKSS